MKPKLISCADQTNFKWVAHNFRHVSTQKNVLGPPPLDLDHIVGRRGHLAPPDRLNCVGARHRYRPSMSLVASSERILWWTISMWSSASQGEPTTVGREGIDEGVFPHSSCDRSTSWREGIDEGVFPHSSCDHSPSFPRVPTYLWYWETDAWKIKPSTAMGGTIFEAFSSGRAVKPPPPRRAVGDSFLLRRRAAVLGSGLSPIREARIEANNLSGSLEE